MLTFVVRRLIALIPVLALVLVMVFLLVRIIPGDPAAILLGPGATSDQIAALRAQLHLDEPFLLQFVGYLGGVLHGDLGTSLKTGTPVLQEILIRLPATLELSISAVIVAGIVAIPLGVISASRPNSAWDHLIRVTSLVGVSAPAFLLALVLQLVFAIYLGWLPVSGRFSPFDTETPITGFAVLDSFLSGNVVAFENALRYLALPTFVLAAFLCGTLSRFIRNTMLEIATEDFVRTARAKGLTRRQVILRHVLRNSLLPALTVLGLQFAELLGGAILTETVFAWPGVGRFMFDAVKNRDYPVIQGTTLVFGLLFMLTSLVVDLLYGVLDPRVRVKIK